MLLAFHYNCFEWKKKVTTCIICKLILASFFIVDNVKQAKIVECFAQFTDLLCFLPEITVEIFLKLIICSVFLFFFLSIYVFFTAYFTLNTIFWEGED